MKRNFYRFPVVVFSIMSYSACYAEASKIVYGLEKAKYFDGRLSNHAPIYIQVGSFIEHSTAVRFQQRLKTQTSRTVHLLHKGNSYPVLVGPLYSSVDVRKTAMSLLGQSEKKVSVSHLSHKKILSSAVLTTPVQSADIRHESLAQSNVPEAPVAQNNPVISNANWFLSVGAGEQFPLALDAMSVNNGSGFPAPYHQDLYSMNPSDGGVLAVSGGRRWERENRWIPAYSAGVLWQHMFSANAHGTIMQYSDPTFVNYNYRWNVKSDMLLAIAKLNLVRYWKLSPYLNGGIGAAWNHTGGYSETALSGVTPRDNPGFSNNTSTQFAYQVGTGVDLQVSPQVIFSLGYNYQNLGRLSSGSGVGTWANNSLSSGTLGSNEVLFSVNYLFEK